MYKVQLTRVLDKNLCAFLSTCPSFNDSSLPRGRGLSAAEESLKSGANCLKNPTKFLSKTRVCYGRQSGQLVNTNPSPIQYLTKEHLANFFLAYRSHKL